MTLPTKLPLLPSALGSTFEGSVDSGSFELLLPKLAPGHPVPTQSLLPPSESQFVQVRGGGPGAWGHFESSAPERSSEPVIAKVSGVVLEVDTAFNSPERLPEFTVAFGVEFSEWYSIAISWLEVWNGLNLSNLQETLPGTTGTIGTPDGSGWANGWSPEERVYITSSTRAVDAQTLGLAFEKATSREVLPSEWKLYLQGAKTFDDRLAIIEAATAVEVALSGAIHRRLTSLTGDAREEVVLNSNGLYGMVKLLQKLDGDKENKLLDRAGKQLARPRNKAVHAGQPPALQDVQDAFLVARELLNKYSPLPAK